MRAVLDPNILIAALISPSGTPARVLARWLSGEFELVVSDTLLAELERALTYPKLRTRITAGEAAEFVSLLRRGATVAQDPPTSTHHSIDPGDDYLLGLAEAAHAVLVTGDQHLLALADPLPIQAARAFLDALEASSGTPCGSSSSRRDRSGGISRRVSGTSAARSSS